MTRDTRPKAQLSKQVVVQSLDPLGLAGPGAGVVRGRHQPRELLEVDLAVTVQVGLHDYGADLGLGKGFPEVGYCQPQLLLAVEAVADGIVPLEGADVVLKAVALLHHHVDKLHHVSSVMSVLTLETLHQIRYLQ